MARRRAKKQNDAPNPMQLVSRGIRPARFNIRGSISDTTVLSGNRRVNHSVVGGQAVFSIALDLDWANRNTDPLADVGAHYRTYKYMPGCVYNHSPAVSLTATGSTIIGYIDNPEQYNRWMALVNVNERIEFVSQLANSKAYPIWQQFAFAVPSYTRRKSFDVNANGAGTGVQDLEHTWQGAILIAYTGVTPADGVVCRSFLHQKLWLSGLGSVVLT